jgi:tRNA(fMet)-specific endonuclease VapC
VTGVSYMLDTNILSHMIRFPEGEAVQSLQISGEANACVSAIVASELRYGAAKRGSRRLTVLVEEMLKRFPIVAYDTGASANYAAIRHALTARGETIGPVALFIAAHARSLDLTLVTANAR